MSKATSVVIGIILAIISCGILIYAYETDRSFTQIMIAFCLLFPPIAFISSINGKVAVFLFSSILIIGGFMIGFGARWAGGCTSGHAISGLSNLQLPSLIAVIGFFIGGLVMIHLLFPLIF